MTKLYYHEQAHLRCHWLKSLLRILLSWCLLKLELQNSNGHFHSLVSSHMSVRHWKETIVNLLIEARRLGFFVHELFY